MAQLLQDMHKPAEPTMGFPIAPDPARGQSAHAVEITQNTQSTLSKFSSDLARMEARLRAAEAAADDAPRPAEQPETAAEPAEGAREDPIATLTKATQKSLSKAEKSLMEKKIALEAKLRSPD